VLALPYSHSPTHPDRNATKIRGDLFALTSQANRLTDHGLRDAELAGNSRCDLSVLRKARQMRYRTCQAKMILTCRSASARVRPIVPIYTSTRRGTTSPDLRNR